MEQWPTEVEDRLTAMIAKIPKTPNLNFDRLILPIEEGPVRDKGTMRTPTELNAPTSRCARSRGGSREWLRNSHVAVLQGERFLHTGVAFYFSMTTALVLSLVDVVDCSAGVLWVCLMSTEASPTWSNGPLKWRIA